MSGRAKADLFAQSNTIRDFRFVRCPFPRPGWRLCSGFRFELWEADMECSIKRRCIAALLLFGMSAHVAAQAPTSAPPDPATITWLTPDFSLGTGETRDSKTMIGPLFDLIEAQWGGGFKHKLVVANAKRSWGMIRGGENACHLVSLRTPDRESIAHYVNTHLVPPVQLIVRAGSLAQLPRNAAGEADLEQVLQRGILRGAVIEGRSYGPALDQLLARRPATTPLETYAPGDFGTRLMQMMAAGRVDYILDYDFNLQQRKQMFPALQDLTPVPLLGFGELQMSGIACPRNAWGAKVIQRLHQLLATPAGIAALKASFEPSLSPQARARYGARIAAYYEQLPAELQRALD